jgi:HSP20 family protein
MNRLFADQRASAVELPPVNVWAGEHGLIVEAQLPGYERDGVEISVASDTLTIKGSRAANELGEGSAYHRRERPSGRFVRTLSLPFRVEDGEIEALLKNGVLTIDLPRAKSDRPRKIQIQSNS